YSTTYIYINKNNPIYKEISAHSLYIGSHKYLNRENLFIEPFEVLVGNTETLSIICFIALILMFYK
ncbi:hypothetical protein ADU89_02380, partial [Clostridium botulinum]